MQCIRENAVAAVPLAPPLNLPMINLKNGLPFAPTCIPSKEVLCMYLSVYTPWVGMWQDKIELQVKIF